MTNTRLISFQLSCLFLLLFNACNTIKTDYDVIIVGGGLAGLSAAKELNTEKVLVLEKDSILGGRVRTANYQEKYFYDFGAVFALDTNYRHEIPIQNHEFIEDAPIAFWLDGKLYSGNTIVDCLSKIPNINLVELMKLSESDTLNSDLLDDYLYELLNTNMKAVFPGALKNYHSGVQSFAFVRYNSSHFEQGNSVILTEYLLKDRKFEYRLNSKVNAVRDKNKYVEVTYEERNNTSKTLTSRKVIVATTATVAKKIISPIHENAMQFLNGVNYASYQTIVVGVSQGNLEPDVSYLMPVHSGFSSILKQKTMDSSFTTFLLYIADEDLKKFKDTTDIKTRTFQILNEIWNIKQADIVFYDTYFWKEAGVLVNEHYLKQWNSNCTVPSANIYLAGDYCQNGMPYGMIPALNSGKLTAQKIKNAAR